jgi:capsular exopolysaccharide synthesis family protein
LPDPDGDFQNYKQTQLALLKNRSVLNAALRDPKVKDLPAVKNRLDPVTWLEKIVIPEFNGEILRISITGGNAEQITLLLDAVRDSYLKEAVGKDHKKRLDRLEQLKSIFTDNDRILRQNKLAWKNVVDDLGSSNAKILAVKQEFALQEVYAIQKELLEVQSQLRKLQLEAEGQSEPAKDVAGLPVPDYLVEEYLKKDYDYNAWSKHVAKLEQELAYLKKNFDRPEKEPRYQETIDGLKAARQGLAACREELHPAAVKYVRDKLQGDTFQQKGSLQDRIDYLTKLQDMLNKEIDNRSKQNQLAGKKANDMEWLKDEIASKEDQVKKVGTQIQDLEVEIQAPRRVNVMDETVIVDNGDKRPKMVALGFCGAFALVVAGVAYLEFRVRRVSSPEEVAQGLRLKLIGTMPVLSKRAKAKPVVPAASPDRQLDSYLVDAVDATRLVLLHTARLESLQVLMMTSAFGGEGKTMLSCHLAVNLACAGFRTLLIDADLRRPAVHKVFHIPSGPGLSEVLRQEVDIAQVIQPGPVEELSILTAGDSQDCPSQLLAHGNLGTLLPALREQYDYVIVDSAPVLPVADSQLIAQYVDGVILSVLRDVSRLPAVHAACERLSMLQVRILGAVVHGVTGESYCQGYGYGSPAASKA